MSCIKELRTKNQLTQSELAKKLRLTTAIVGMYETGVRNPSYAVLIRLSKVFNVTVDTIMNGDSLSNLGMAKISDGYNNSKVNLLELLYKEILTEDEKSEFILYANMFIHCI